MFETDHGKTGMLVCWDMAWSEAFRSVSPPRSVLNPAILHTRPADPPLLSAPPPRRRSCHLVRPYPFSPRSQLLPSTRAC